MKSGLGASWTYDSLLLRNTHEPECVTGTQHKHDLALRPCWTHSVVGWGGMISTTPGLILSQKGSQRIKKSPSPWSQKRKLEKRSTLE